MADDTTLELKREQIDVLLAATALGLSLYELRDMLCHEAARRLGMAASSVAGGWTTVDFPRIQSILDAIEAVDQAINETAAGI